MAKDPAFPFYAQDYLVDTIRWTRDMQGLHVSLMAESWANGGLPNEDGKPMGLGSTDVPIWFKIKHKWELVNGMWINKKIEEVRAERNAFRQKQREKGILSGQRRNRKQTIVQPISQPDTNSGSTVVEPIESEDEDEDEIEIERKGKEVKEGRVYSDEWFDSIFHTRVIEGCKMNFPHKNVENELAIFRMRVRVSPDYTSRDSGGLFNAFVHQLQKPGGNTRAAPMVEKPTFEELKKMLDS